MTDKTDMSKECTLEKLGFYLEKRADVWVVVDDCEGVHPASLNERVLWLALQELTASSFTAADMATASAQGFRDGVASASVNSDGSITPGTWAHLKLMMEESAWGGEIQLSDALANVDEFARASLAASAGSEPVAADGWLHENGLLYRLTDERHPCNRDEINVTMADGSRSIEARSRRALELLDRIRATHPSPPEGMVMVPKEPTDAMLDAVEEEVGGHCYSCSKWRASHDDCRRIWAAMIAATPPTTSAGSGKGE